MTNENSDDIDPVDRVINMIREYYADAEVMAAWGSADEEGQIPFEATKTIDQFGHRWRRKKCVEGNLIFHAGISARQIAEGKYSSPDDPALRARLEQSRVSIEKAAQWLTQQGNLNHEK